MYLWHSYKQTTLLCGGMFGLLVGLAMAQRTDCPLNLLMVSCCCLITLFVFLRYGKTSLLLAMLVVVGFMIGWLRGDAVRADLADYQQFVGQEVVVQGEVFDDPSYDDNRRLDFKLTNCRINGHEVRGVIRIKALGGSLHRGNSVEVKGKLARGFGNYQATMYFVSPKVVDAADGPIESLRRYFFASVASAVPDPQASLGLGFVVGLTSYLPDSLQEQLRALALTHVVVASGYNLTILLRIIRRLLASYSKRLACAGGVAFMCLMIALTGASPSITRAAIVTCLSLAAWYFGRRVHPVVILLLGAAITAIYNPLYLWFDLGWWLSFVAFAGVLLLAPLLQRLWYKDREPPLLMQITIETIAAQLATTPLILGVFGSLSVLGLVGNILVVPFVPLAMAATTLTGFCGMLLPQLGSWLGIIANLIIGYMIKIITNFGALPWAAVEIKISTFWMFVFFGGLFLLGVILYRFTRHSFAQQPGIVE